MLGDRKLTLAKEDEEEIRKQLSKLFDGMMRTLFKQEGASFNIEIMADKPVQDFIEAHASVLDSGFQKVEMSDAMRRRLTRSDYIFSGMKTFHELNEAFPSLLDENGNRKTFEQFLNDVRKIDKTYNRDYLRAEYNFVQASATMAVKWERFAEDGDRYNIQWRTAGDNRVRPEHEILNGLTLPITDSFWKDHWPPLSWGCRCTTVQVRKSKYPVTPHDEAVRLADEATQNDKHADMFRFNSGLKGKTMPDYNPYTIRRCNDCDIAKGRLKLAKVFIPENEVCAACQFIRTCELNRERTVQYGKGTISVSNMVNPKDSDYIKLVEIAEFFAKDGAKVKLTPKMSRPSKFNYECVYGSLMGTKFEGKCPDLCINGVWYEHEGFISNNPKRAFRNMLNDGLKQSDRLIIDKPDLTEAYMKRIIRQRITDGQTISEVWLRTEEGIEILYKKSEE